MTRADLLAWMYRLSFNRKTAASALGIAPRTLDRYLAHTKPRAVSRSLELLCGYIEQDRDGERS